MASSSDRTSARTEELYRQHEQRIARWVQRLGGPKLDLEETVQEVFVVVHQNVANFSGPATLPWLYRITENVVHNKLRRERWRAWMRGGRKLQEKINQVPSLEPSAVERIDQGQAIEVIYRVLDQLSERSRSVLILFELEGLSGQEIAELKGTSAGTVWVWLHRARAEFVKRFEKLQAELKKEEEGL